MGKKSMKDINYFRVHNCGAFINDWNWMIDPKNGTNLLTVLLTL